MLFEISVAAHVGVVCGYGCEQARLVVGLVKVVVLEDGFKLLVGKHAVLKTLAAGKVYQRAFVFSVGSDDGSADTLEETRKVAFVLY